VKLVENDVPDEERKATMNYVNPMYIPHNSLCQSAIDAAEQGDYEEVRRLLKVMQHTYDEPGYGEVCMVAPCLDGLGSYNDRGIQHVAQGDAKK
jgi:serine/tyrosine/threonine adenylyltransferase